MEINKYSQKIINFLNNYNINFNINYDNNPFIKNLQDKFKITTHITLTLTDTFKLSKLHNKKEYPLVYILWLKAYKTGNAEKYFNFLPDLNDFNIFIEWYRMHHHLIDVGEIEEYEILFEKNTNRKLLHEQIYNNSFISLDIQHHCETENLIYEKYESKNICINLFYIDDKPDLQLVSKIISFMQNISESKNFVKLTIIYGKQKKLITFKNILCPDNINSGSTYPGHSITIWRKEEFYKVLIHELVHYVNFDQYIYNNLNYQIQSILNKYISVTKDNVNESYTEIIAITIHTIMMSILLDKSFTELLILEIKYSCFQIGKIINFYNGNNITQLLNKEIKIKQTTSGCSYYIIKAFMLFNLTLIINFWQSQGLTINNKNKKEYIELYEKIFEIDDIFVKLINKFIQDIKLLKDNFIKNTLRMSCLQIK
jgi:hypothetical protein